MLWHGLDIELYKTRYPEVIFGCPQLTNIWGNPEIGRGTKVGAFVEIGRGAIIGKGCRICVGSVINWGVTIGNGVFVGPGTIFCNDRNPPSDNWERVVVENDVVIGAGCIILPGITIGAGAKVGAGLVVRKSIPTGGQLLHEHIQRYPRKGRFQADTEEEPR